MPDAITVPEPPDTGVSALEPLYAPHEEPTRHRVRGEEGGPAKIVPHRRPTTMPSRRICAGWCAAGGRRIIQAPRRRRGSCCTIGLAAIMCSISGSGQRVPFRYYFCQREAIETLIYLYEACRT